MSYEMKPLSCDLTGLKGLSEKLIVSHWQNVTKLLRALDR